MIARLKALKQRESGKTGREPPACSFGVENDKRDKSGPRTLWVLGVKLVTFLAIQGSSWHSHSLSVLLQAQKWDWASDKQLSCS